MRTAFCCMSLCAYLLLSCANDGPKGTVLKEEAMGRVLFDLLQADAFSEQFLGADSLGRSKKVIALQEQIFSLHNISQADFQASYSYYAGNPTLMTRILDSIVSRSEQSRSVMMMERYSNSKQPLEQTGN